MSQDYARELIISIQLDPEVEAKIDENQLPVQFIHDPANIAEKDLENIKFYFQTHAVDLTDPVLKMAARLATLSTKEKTKITLTHRTPDLSFAALGTEENLLPVINNVTTDRERWKICKWDEKLQKKQTVGKKDLDRKIVSNKNVDGNLGEKIAKCIEGIETVLKKDEDCDDKLLAELKSAVSNWINTLKSTNFNQGWRSGCVRESQERLLPTEGFYRLFHGLWCPGLACTKLVKFLL